MIFYNNRNCNCHHWEDENNSNMNTQKTNCCTRQIEETFCYPSYYEEKCENNYEHLHENQYETYYEGNFIIFPQKCYHHTNNCHKKQTENHNCKLYQENTKPSCKNTTNNKCCFCRLFGRW